MATTDDQRPIFRPMIISVIALSLLALCCCYGLFHSCSRSDSNRGLPPSIPTASPSPSDTTSPAAAPPTPSETTASPPPSATPTEANPAPAPPSTPLDLNRACGSAWSGARAAAVTRSLSVRCVTSKERQWSVDIDHQVCHHPGSQFDPNLRIWYCTNDDGSKGDAVGWSSVCFNLYEADWKDIAPDDPNGFGFRCIKSVTETAGYLSLDSLNAYCSNTVDGAHFAYIATDGRWGCH